MYQEAMTIVNNLLAFTRNLSTHTLSQQTQTHDRLHRNS